MQSQRTDQRSTESNPDGRRDIEQSTNQSKSGLGNTEVSDKANRTVCLTANLVGAGRASA